LFKVVKSSFYAPDVLYRELVAETGSSGVVAIVWASFEKGDGAVFVSVEGQGVVE
jgi:hypothetical protein